MQGWFTARDVRRILRFDGYGFPHEMIYRESVTLSGVEHELSRVFRAQRVIIFRNSSDLVLKDSMVDGVSVCST